MQKQWVHPEYQIRFCEEAAFAGAGASLALPREIRFENTTLLGLVVTALIAICILIPSTVNQARLFGQAKVVAPREEQFSLSRLNPKNKELFLSLVSLQERREIASQVHYVSEIVKSAAPTNTGALDLATSIVFESRRANVDPLLVAAIIKSESTFNRHARSHSGALGLMQLLPGTGRYISEKAEMDWHGAEKLNDSDYNIRLGVAYIKYLSRNFENNLEHALIAYNWGPGNLDRALKNARKIPASPLHYAQKILGNQARWTNEFETRKAEFQYLQIGAGAQA